MRRVLLIVLGLLLIALAAAWFLTPLGEEVMASLAPPEPLTRGFGPEATPAIATEHLNTILNALNALFAAVGVYLTARNLRPR